MPQGRLSIFAEEKARKYSWEGISGGQVGEEGWASSYRVLEAIARILSFLTHKIGVHLKAYIDVEEDSAGSIW